jgi:hypothetical protein
MKTYEIVQGKNTGATAVKLLRKPFRNMIVSFGKVGIRETKNGAGLAFDFSVIKGKMPKTSAKIALLENTLGDILVDILENNIDDVEFTGGND